MNFSHGAARRPALSAPILAIVVVQAASCGPIAQGNPAVGDLAFLDDQGYTQWSRAKIPRWTTVTFDAQHDALQLNGWTTTLRVQAGALASSPYPRWELTHHRSSLEGKSAELANIFSGGTEATGAWQFGTAKDAYSNMTAHQDALSKNDAFQMEAIVYDYAPYTPIVHAFPVRAADVPREGLRVYDHGACPGFVLWDEIFADLPYAVTKSIAEMAFCVEVFGGKAIDTMIRHALGFFPTFTRTPSTPYAIGGPGDGFAIFSGIELGTAAGPNFHAANYTRYEILAQNGKVAINRVFGAWRGTRRSAPPSIRATAARCPLRSARRSTAAPSSSCGCLSRAWAPSAAAGRHATSRTCLALRARRATFRTARSASRSRSSLGSRRTTTGWCPT